MNSVRIVDEIVKRINKKKTFELYTRWSWIPDYHSTLISIIPYKFLYNKVHTGNGY